jgi:two-component system chemotaxis sensor kinase CheA
MNMDQVLQTFYDESRELLVDMEIILLDLEFHPDDLELKNALFRCVHTIKGSSGMFGFDHVVGFTHVVENILDRLRAGDLEYSRDLAQLLLQSRDHIKTLVDSDQSALSDDLKNHQAQLLVALEAYHQLSETTDAVSAEAESVCAPECGDEAARWHISLRFDSDVFRHGMDPLGFIRFLLTVGEIVSLHTLAQKIPDMTQMDPESCYLGFEIGLQSSATQEEIRAIFEFVETLCEITIIPPASPLSHFYQWLEKFPEDERLELTDWLLEDGEISAAQHSALVSGDLTAFTDTVALAATDLSGFDIQHSTSETVTEKTPVARDTSASRTQYIRVPADKLDQLISLVGELVISSSTVVVNAAQGGDKNTRESAATMSMLVDDIRDAALDLRMVPIGECFQRFQRIVRDVSDDLGKDIYLSIQGADTELDKSLVEKITDPLTHLVRNACDHGLERAEQRLAKGKTAQGTLRLNAYHQAGHVVIEISDDGNGLDAERIRAKALEKGLIHAEQTLSEQEIFNLIFEPGFSTAEKVTNLSGRGVGMDVVKKSIQALRGSIEVLSRPGEGSTFRLRLPLTLAIIDGFVASVGQAVYVVPLESVVECIEFPIEEQREATRQQFINLRSEVLPFIQLSEHFNVANHVKGRRQNIIVVNHGGKKVGLVVDALHGEHQTVIKPLGRLFAHLQGLAGSTIMGNGQVALILDVAALIEQVATVEEDRFSNKRKQFH